MNLEFVQDLSSRLPYGVFCKIKTKNSEYVEKLKIHHLGYCIYDGFFNYTIKPYLRPILDITEDELALIYNDITFYDKKTVEWIDSFDSFAKMVKDFNGFDCFLVSADDSLKLIDFYNKFHFDYKGLIPKGLAYQTDFYGIKELQKTKL